MRGVLDAVDARVRMGAWIRRGAGSHPRLLVAAAMFSLVVGIALRETLTANRSPVSPATHAHALAARGMAALPATLRGPLSAAMGADDPGYFATSAPAGRLAARTPVPEPHQHLRPRRGHGPLCRRAAVSRAAWHRLRRRPLARRPRDSACAGEPRRLLAPRCQRVVRERPAGPRAGLHRRAAPGRRQGGAVDARAEPLRQRARRGRACGQELHRRLARLHRPHRRRRTRTAAPQPSADRRRDACC